MEENKTLYIFIGGLFGGLLRKDFVFSYFKDMQNFIEENNTYVETEFIQNPYHKSIKDGANLIAQKIHEACVLNNSQVILIGHSRGSAELLTFLAEYPELAGLNNIKKIVFSSPLFGISHMAKLAVEKLSFTLPKKLHFSLQEVATEEYATTVKDNWNKVLSNQGHKFKDKCLIIKTASNKPQHFPTFLKISSYLISKAGGGINDGVLALSSQQDLKGVRAVRVNSNHGAIFCNKKVNKQAQVNIGDIYQFIDYRQINNYENEVYFQYADKQIDQDYNVFS